MYKYLPTILSLIVAASLSSIAHSQPVAGAPEWQMSAGGGVMFAPSFRGSNDYQLLALPNIQIAYGNLFEASVQRGLRYNLVRSSGFTAGPVAKLDFGREEDGIQPFRIAGKATTALLGMGDVGATIELGGFLNYAQGPVTASLELRHGANGHRGLVGEVGINYARRSRMQDIGVIFSIGPSLTFSDSSYAQTFFGVNAAQSSGAALDVFNAGGGINSYGIGSSAVFLFNERFSATLIARYDRLVGDAEASPLVNERGSANQAIVGLFLTYRLWSSSI
jgi:outer membrane scaffolding protein for murein synthesis (MipA/OmpV family)